MLWNYFTNISKLFWKCSNFIAKRVIVYAEIVLWRIANGYLYLSAMKDIHCATISISLEAPDAKVYLQRNSRLLLSWLEPFRSVTCSCLGVCFDGLPRVSHQTVVTSTHNIDSRCLHTTDLLLSLFMLPDDPLN